MLRLLLLLSTLLFVFQLLVAAVAFSGLFLQILLGAFWHVVLFTHSAGLQTILFNGQRLYRENTGAAVGMFVLEVRVDVHS